MNLGTLKKNLRDHPGTNVRFVLPDGDPIAADFHVTEVGHVVKNFIDCGGTVRRVESCLLQAWVAENDADHRLTAAKLAHVLEISAKVIPSEELDVELEYEAGRTSQYKVDGAEAAGGELRFQLSHKHTDCLARDACGVGLQGTQCCEVAGKCC
jgi:hypothetical protein